MNTKVWIIRLMVISILLSSCSSVFSKPTATPTPTIVPTNTPLPPCYIQAEDFIFMSGEILEELNDVHRLADVLVRARGDLTESISNLKDLRWDIDSLEVPFCANKVHELMLEFIRLEIQYYSVYADDKKPKQRLIDDLNEILNTFAVEYARLETGASPYDK